MPSDVEEYVSRLPWAVPWRWSPNAVTRDSFGDRLELTQIGDGALARATVWVIQGEVVRTQFQDDSKPRVMGTEAFLSRLHSENVRAEHRLHQMAWDTGLRP